MTAQLFDPRMLRQQIADVFTEGDLRRLCYDLQIDFDELAGRRKSEKIIDLLIYVEDRGLMDRLLEILKQERPHVDWPTAPADVRDDEPGPGLTDEESLLTSPPLLRGDDGLFWTKPYGEPSWVKIPAGEFWMGNDNRRENEKPLHKVTLDSYLIAPTPVTNAQYYLFTQATGYRTPDHWQRDKIPKDLENHPVVYVNIRDAEAFCRWLSQATNKQVMLPDEAQWEKAARGPKDQRNFPWGDVFDATLCNTEESGFGTTSVVGRFMGGASPYHLLDICGNVWEWTRRPPINYPYKPENDGADDKNTLRVKRGGSYNSISRLARCSYRTWDYLDIRSKDDGFRVIATA